MFSISHYLDSTLSGIVARYFVQNGLYNRHDKKIRERPKNIVCLEFFSWDGIAAGLLLGSGFMFIFTLFGCSAQSCFCSTWS